MSIDLRTGKHRRVLFFVFILFALAVTLVLPYQFRSWAADRSRSSPEQTKSRLDAPANYDIRDDKQAGEAIAWYRNDLGGSKSKLTDLRSGFVRGAEELRSAIPAIKLVYNSDAAPPEVIGGDVSRGKAFLSEPSTLKRPAILKNFINQNSDLIGITALEVQNLNVTAEYTNPDGNLSYVVLKQQINSVPVFRGEIKAGFDRSRQLIRVVNNFAPGLDESSVSTDFGDPTDAVRTAYRFIGGEPAPDLTQSKESTEAKAIFGTGDFATTAEKVYFPTEPGVAVAAWRVLIWGRVNAYYVIVDAKTNTLLWRKNLTADQTQPATYSVYANPNAMMNIARNPFPVVSGPISPNGLQGTGIPRTSISRIGNEAPYSFNALGWLTDGVTITDGNNVQAGLDRDPANGIDPNSEASSADRDFTFAYSPLDPNTNTGDDPIPSPQTYPGSQYQQGVVTQLFYVSNWFHDETYRLGFNEAAGNFQNVNFTGQGLGADRVSAEAQDSSGTNNANFSSGSDGTRGRMQMYLFPGSNPDIDGSLDTDVVVHELAHGLSNRLHGDGTGLFNDMSRGMGEGWSDFYALSMLSQPNDPIDGVYAAGSYATYRITGTFANNNYYGIRRFPYAVISATGGPNNRPHNPLTFADIDQSTIDLTDGAFARGPVGGANGDEVHNSGEIWCSALWEIRARMVSRLGWEAGNRKVLQLVTDGMKLAPLSPTFLSERDAIIAATIASGTSEDVADMWAGFAARGLGANASIQNNGGVSIGGTGTIRVTQSFDLPNLSQTPNLTIAGDGTAGPGQTVELAIALSNSTGITALGTSLSIGNGVPIYYGTIGNAATVVKNVAYTVPANTECGAVITLTLNVNSSLGPVSFVRTFAVGESSVGFQENFDALTPPGIPDGWTVTSSYGPMTFVSTASSSDTTPNSMFAADLPNCTGSGCPDNVGGSTELTSPPMQISAEATTVSFRHSYNTEHGWDGGVFEISIDGGAYQDFVGAGGVFLQNGYNGTMGVSPPNPLGGRAGWTGSSGGYVTTVGRVPPSAAHKSIKLRWRFGADDNSAPAGGGWNVDSIRIFSNFACNIPGPSRAKRSDFDGDGRSDISVYRPADGRWWLSRSTAGEVPITFGTAEDIPAPGDFDGDGKTDISVFRPSDGTWYRINSGNGAVAANQFGSSGDVPQSGDFDGDGKDDLAVFRPSSSTFWILLSSNGEVRSYLWGIGTDLPVAGDYDGDGKDDVAVFRPSEGAWYVLKSSDGQPLAVNLGMTGDIPANADFDGDGRQDMAVFRPSEGKWYIMASSGYTQVVGWGQNGDIPVPGDYDGDGKDDVGVFRDGSWYIWGTTVGLLETKYGLLSDIPIPNKYIPVRQ